MSISRFTPRFAALLLLFCAAAFLAPLRALAQDQDGPPDGDDPSTRVARISHTDGAVSFNPAGTDDWVGAVVNRPMTTGDKLWSDNGARAELHIGSASLRIGSTTGFSFLNLSDDVAQIQITEGTLRVRVKRLEQNETFEIDTPNLAFSILRPGTYRISVNENGDNTEVSVIGGEGEVTGGGQAYSVHAEQTATFVGTDQLDADVQQLAGDDEFDQWCAQRDVREDRSASARYVSPDVVGYEDLDEYGGWRPVPEYGTVWFPHTTVVGWAPYRYGHWVYIAPWGYTWVEDEPWGYAPFHYGRWVVVGGVWGWVPAPPQVVGVAYVRPVYAPALVAWVGGPHFGVAVGSNVGWFPLGPREVYVPSYQVSRRYCERINVSNTRVDRVVVNNYYTTVVVNKQVNVTNVTYVNQRARGAVTATSGSTFVSGQNVSRNVVRVDQREIVSSHVVAGAPAIAPNRQTFVGAGRPAAVRPPATIQTRTVVAKAPPPPAPMNVDRQEAAIRANGGRPVATPQYRRGSPQPQGAAAGNAAAANAVPRNNVRIAPVAHTVTPIQPKPANNVATRPGQPANNNVVRPGQPPVNNNAPRPGQPLNNGQPVNSAVNPNAPRPNQPAPGVAPQQNQNPTPVNAPANARGYNNRPPNARPVAAPVNPQVQQQQQQQLEKLRTQQDAERQKLEQRQVQQQQKVQAAPNPNIQKQQQVNEKQTQQLQNMERKHDNQAQTLQNRQAVQNNQAAQHAGNPNQNNKPPKDKDNKQNKQN
ncbi:MAG TPA: DUF6600 domain-containing protein [Candidatus Acidoferrum sp.]|jgi:hypothetical protein